MSTSYPAEHVVHAERSQPFGVERRVESVGDDTRRGIEASNVRDDRRREARRRVHRQVEPHEIRGGHRVVLHALLGEVNALDGAASGAHPITIAAGSGSVSERT